MSKPVANVKNAKHSQIVVKEFSCYKKASSYLQLENAQVINQNKNSNLDHSNFDDIHEIDKQNISEQNNSLVLESIPKESKNYLLQKISSKENLHEIIKINNKSINDSKSIEGYYHTHKNHTEPKCSSQMKGKSPNYTYSNELNCTKIVKNPTKTNKYSDNSKNLSNKSKYLFNNSINSVSSIDNYNKHENSSFIQDKSLEKTNISNNDYKEYLKNAKIAQVISEEFHKKLSQLRNCKNGTDKIKIKLCMHFLKALVEYDKPYSTVISEIKTIIESYNQMTLSEHELSIDSLKNQLESEKKKSEKLAEEIRLLKIQHIQINETDMSYSINELNNQLRKSNNFKENENKNIVLSKTGIIIPKLDLSVITEARKLEPIKVVPPLNKSAISKVEYTKSTKHILAKSKSASKTFFLNKYM